MTLHAHAANTCLGWVVAHRAVVHGAIVHGAVVHGVQGGSLRMEVRLLGVACRVQLITSSPFLSSLLFPELANVGLASAISLPIRCS